MKKEKALWLRKIEAEEQVSAAIFFGLTELVAVCIWLVAFFSAERVTFGYWLWLTEIGFFFSLNVWYFRRTKKKLAHLASEGV